MEADAVRAFFTHISGLNILPVVWPNTDQLSEEIESAPAHLRVAILNTRPETLKTNGRSRHKWILQVSVYFKQDSGVFTAAQYVDSVTDGIPFNTVLTSGEFTFKTTSQGAVIPTVNTDNWLFTPIQFQFQTFK